MRVPQLARMLAPFACASLLSLVIFSGAKLSTSGPLDDRRAPTLELWHVAEDQAAVCVVLVRKSRREHPRARVGASRGALDELVDIVHRLSRVEPSR